MNVVMLVQACTNAGKIPRDRLDCLMGSRVLKMAQNESVRHLNQVRIVSITSFVFVFI